MDNKRRKIERGIYESPVGSLTYYIYYYFDGRRKKQKIGQGRAFLRIAREKLLTIRSDLLRGTYIEKKKTSPVYVKDFAKEYLDYCQSKTLMNMEWSKSGIYQKSAMKNLLPVFGNKQLTKVSPADVDKYMMQRKTEVKNRTVNLEFVVLKHMFNLAIKWGKVKKNPTNQSKKLPVEEKFPKYLTPEQIGKLYNECAAHLLPVVKLAISTGMRRGELLSLKWDDVDFENSIIYVNKSKSGKPREIPLNNTAESALMAVERNAKSEYVFCNKKGKKFFNLKRSFKTALKKAGLADKGFVFHTLRHTFASLLVMKGVDILTVKQLLGHSKLETTMIYAHLSPKHKRLAVELGDMDFSGQQATKQPLTLSRDFSAIGNIDKNLYNTSNYR